MRSYICSSCDGSIIVGHPASILRRQAIALARESYGLLQRLLHGGRIVRTLALALEERFYLAPHRYRALPSACPRCGYRGRGDLPWWRPGLEA